MLDVVYGKLTDRHFDLQVTCVYLPEEITTTTDECVTSFDLITHIKYAYKLTCTHQCALISHLTFS